MPRVAVDVPGARYEIVVGLLSMRDRKRLRLRVQVPGDDPVVPSLFDVHPGAEALEREVYDMFGIRFRNHPDLRRILLWKDYPAHPLRKDYPLRGRGERETYRITQRNET